VGAGLPVFPLVSPTTQCGSDDPCQLFPKLARKTGVPSHTQIPRLMAKKPWVK